MPFVCSLPSCRLEWYRNIVTRKNFWLLTECRFINFSSEKRLYFYDYNLTDCLAKYIDQSSSYNSSVTCSDTTWHLRPPVVLWSRGEHSFSHLVNLLSCPGPVSHQVLHINIFIHIIKSYSNANDGVWKTKSFLSKW